MRIIVSAPPAGGPDIVARLLADRLAQRWGQAVVVENRPGAGGNLGAGEVAAAEPDGYTLLSAQPAPLTTNVLLYRKLNFDPTALEPVIVMTTLPNALVVRQDFPASSVAELIAYARANPGKINYGSQGIGTTPHLTAELFARRTGTVLTHVPYRGTAQAVNDLVAGHLDLLFMQIDAVREHFAAGKIKMLAVTTPERLADAAGRAHHGGGRRRGFPLRHLERHRGAAAYAPPGHRQDQRRHERGAAVAGDRAATRAARHAASRRQSRRHGGLRRRGDPPLGRGDQGGEHFGELKRPPLTLAV